MKYKEIKIALVAIIGVIILFFGMNFLKGVSLFSDDNMYYLTFDNIKGLSESTPVTADGFKVGRVKSINYDYTRKGETQVEVGIEKDMVIPQGTKAEITSDLLGNVQVELQFPEVEGAPIPPGGIIRGEQSGGAIAQVKNMLPQVQNILPKVDSILASVNSLLADPSIRGSLNNVHTITDNLKGSTLQLNTLMAGVNKEVPGLMSKADNTLGQTAEVMDNAKKMTAKLAELDLQNAIAELEQTLGNLKSFTEQLNKKDGSLGLLMNDPSFYQNLNVVMVQADSLLTDLRQHPKRYVHFSVFGKKDK